MHIMFSTGLDLLQSSGRFPGDVCHIGEGQQELLLHIILIIAVHGTEELLIAVKRVLD